MMEWENQEKVALLPVRVALGLHQCAAQAPLPAHLAGDAPWEPKDLLLCVASMVGQEQALLLWSQLLQALQPALLDEELAPELLEAVFQGLAAGDFGQLLQGVLGQTALAQPLLHYGGGPLCGGLLYQCLAQSPGEAAPLLACYQNGPSLPRRWSYEKMLELLLEKCRRQGGLGLEGARALGRAIGKTPPGVVPKLQELHRAAFGPTADAQRPPPQVPPAKAPPPPGSELVEVLLDRRRQALCPQRPLLQGAQFLEVVQLGPPGHYPGPETLPLWDGKGQPIGQLPMERLPPHQRALVRGLLGRGHLVFAALDGQISLPSAGVFCAALYWQKR